MIIITSDDYGKTALATDSIIQCFINGRITSASAMVFMEDSERAASLAIPAGIEVGLHINFTTPFSVAKIASLLRDHHSRVASYLTKNDLAQIIYNPSLAGSFDYLFKAQLEEFNRLYGREPDFYNGHHHMHLCANMLMGKRLPKRAFVRRTFTIGRGEKDVFTLIYRRLLDVIVDRRFLSTDYFFNIQPLGNIVRLQAIFDRADNHSIEIEVHPENADEIDFLLSDQYLSLLRSVHVVRFQELAYRS